MFKLVVGVRRLKPHPVSPIEWSRARLWLHMQPLACLTPPTVLRLTNLESWGGAASAPGHLQLWAGGGVELWAELNSKKRHPESY